MSLKMNFYDIAANEFSRTRTKMLNGVKKFFDSLPLNSSILDAGCGNGKNMTD